MSGLLTEDELNARKQIEAEVKAYVRDQEPHMAMPDFKGWADYVNFWTTVMGNPAPTNTGPL
jgi:hypothetical protein